MTDRLRVSTKADIYSRYGFLSLSSVLTRKILSIDFNVPVTIIIFHMGLLNKELILYSTKGSSEPRFLPLFLGFRLFPVT